MFYHGSHQQGFCVRGLGEAGRSRAIGSERCTASLKLSRTPCVEEEAELPARVGLGWDGGVAPERVGLWAWVTRECLGGGEICFQIEKQRLSLSASKQQGFSLTYNTSLRN